MDLDSLRKQMDAIDAEILALVKKRMDVSRKMAEVKKGSKMNVFQPDREVQLISTRKRLAEGLGISEELTAEIFQLLLKESRKVQKEYLAFSYDVIPKELHLRKKQIPLSDVGLQDIFFRIAADSENFFFLESLGEDEWSHHSFIGFSPSAVLTARGNDFFINEQKVPNPESKTPLELLEEFFLPFSSITSGKSFYGGLVGYFGTESVRYFDPALSFLESSPEFPDFCFGLFLDGLRYDRKRNSLEYFYWDEDRSEMIDTMLKKSASAQDLQVQSPGELSSDTEFENIVASLKEEIIAGNVYQIVPSRKYEYTIEGSLIPFYMKLREINPSPHMYFLHFNDLQIIGSSPELIARVQGEKIETFPIAGTRARGKTPKEDAQKASELLADEKEVAEHMMLVDMARNDLGRVCVYGSVGVNRLMSIKKFSHVQHIVSEVSGILRNDVSALTGMMANFPMGTVCGSPRIEAMKILTKIEKSPRGPFGGSVGFWSFSGDATFVLSIRTLFVKGNKATAQAGAGIVYDSIPENERKEVDKKTRHIREILKEFEK